LDSFFGGGINIEFFLLALFLITSKGQKINRKVTNDVGLIFCINLLSLCILM